jgi:signal transduction histidine kinase
VFAAVAVIATVLLTWISWRSVRVALEGEFTRRLEGVAVTGASQVSPADLADAQLFGEDGTGFLAIQLLLDQLRTTPGTMHVSLLDSVRTVVYDTRGADLLRQPSPLDTVIRPALMLALAGRPTTTDPYRMGGVPLRAGLAPIRDAGGGVAGVLAVEAGIGYAPLLERFRQTLLLTSLIIVLAILVLVVVRYRLARRAAELEHRLTRAENLAAMGRLTATLAHEIKNPLAVIRGSAQRLAKLDPEAQRWADSVVEETDRLSRTVGRYLQFARTESPPLATGDARAALDATLDLLEGELRARRIELARPDRRSAGSPDPAGTRPALPVRLDNESLKQAYLNLILNALEAMPEGGRLAIDVGEGRGRAEVRIEDSGAGIPPEVLRRVGDPFYTTKARGSGLGLFLTRRLVESAGGSLEIDSAPGRGTRCVIRLPRAKDGP